MQNISKINLYLYISVIEVLYILYILRYFKTNVSFHYGNIQNYFINLSQYLGINKNYFKHPIYYSQEPINHICPFGHQMAIVIAIFLIMRVYLLGINKYSKKINYIVLLLIFIGSFMNLNAVIYLIPFFVMELYLNIKLI